MRRLFTRIQNFIFLHYRLVLLTGLIITPFATYYMTRLKLDSDLSHLLPSRTPSVQSLQRLQREFQRGGLVVGVIEGKYQTATRFLDALADDLRGMKGVSYVDSQKPLEFFKRHGALFLSREDLEEIINRLVRSKEAIKEGADPRFSRFMNFLEGDEDPFRFEDIEAKYSERGILPKRAVDPYYVDDEQNTVAFMIRGDVGTLDFKTARDFLSRIRTETDRRLAQGIEYRNLKVHYTGDLTQFVEQTERLKSEISRVLLIVFFLIALLIYFFYRRIASVVLICLPLAVGLVWTAALTWFLIGHINIMTSFAGGALLGLGSDYGIYLLSRFFQENRKEASFRQALLNTFTRTSRAVISACWTTVAVLAVLLIPDFKASYEFGLIGIVGMAVTAVMMFVYLPALIVWFHHLGLLKNEIKVLPDVLGQLVPATRLSPFLSSALVGLFLVVGALSLYAGRNRLSLEHNLKQFQSYNPPLPSLVWEKKAREALGAAFNPTAVIVDGKEEEKFVTAELDRQKNGSGGVIRDVVSLSSLVPDRQEEKIRLIRRIQKELAGLPADVREAGRFFATQLERTISEGDIPGEIKRLFLPTEPSSESRLVLVHPGIKRETSEAIKAFAHELRDIPTPGGRRITASGEYLVLADILEIIEKSAFPLLGLSLAVLFAIVGLDFRSLSIGAVQVLSLSLGVAVMIGGMRLAGLHFNVFNIALIPVILGTGIDGFIHLHHRYLENEPDPSLRGALLSMIGPITLSSLTSVIGFGGFVLSGNDGLRTIGAMAICGLLSVYAVTVAFYPALLHLRAKFKKRSHALLPSGADVGVTRPKPPGGKGLIDTL
ncbi:MAG: MMPL family transporter [Deltaproteobacteria bacterium]|nr:MMPL family transporter [Deltaproteobacteria bacterium]